LLAALIGLWKRKHCKKRAKGNLKILKHFVRSKRQPVDKISKKEAKIFWKHHCLFENYIIFLF
jgi:hypothetical protein